MIYRTHLAIPGLFWAIKNKISSPCEVYETVVCSRDQYATRLTASDLLLWAPPTGASSAGMKALKSLGTWKKIVIGIPLMYVRLSSHASAEDHIQFVVQSMEECMYSTGSIFA